MSSGLKIAHVSPYPWEAEDNPVNAHIREVTAELSRRGHSVIVLAPSRSEERVRAARSDPAALLRNGASGGEPHVLSVGEVIDVPGAARRRPPALPIDVARTVE